MTGTGNAHAAGKFTNTLELDTATKQSEVVRANEMVRANIVSPREEGGRPDQSIDKVMAAQLKAPKKDVERRMDAQSAGNSQTFF